MNNLDKQYTALLQDILDNGVTKQDRTGTGTLSVFGRQIRHKMSDGFPLLTTKKMPFRLIATELLWFLRGDTNIKSLVDNDCHIWDGDAYQSYCKRYCELYERDKIEYGSSYYIHETNEYEFEYYSQEEFIDKIKTDDEFAQKWGNLGPIYGKQWRNWDYWTGLKLGDRVLNNKKSIDQIANLIKDLKTNPDSRRLMVNAWNVGELDQMVLPPCHYGFQFYTRELSLEERLVLLKLENIENILHELPNEGEKDSKDYLSFCKGRCDEKNIPTRAISLMWNQRSVDTFLGLPFNIASYGLLLEIIAKEVNMVPDELIGNLGDTHLYLNHVEQAKEQIGRELTDEERAKLMDEKLGVSERILPYLTATLGKHKIPKRTREPYPLPTLKHTKTDEFYKALSEDASLFTHLDINDFSVEGYQSHSHIKAPLSN
jgi:thymidylate synthase